MAKSYRDILVALCLVAGSVGAAGPALAQPGVAPSVVPAPVAPATDVAQARDLFSRLVAREAAFDPTTKQELYADSATMDFSLQYSDGTVAPIPTTIADVRRAAADSMQLARSQGISETYTDTVYTPLGDGRVRVDCRIVFSDGGPPSTMSQVMGPDPASGRFLVLAETVRMVEMPDPGAPKAAGPGV